MCRQSLRAARVLAASRHQKFKVPCEISGSGAHVPPHCLAQLSSCAEEKSRLFTENFLLILAVLAKS